MRNTIFTLLLLLGKLFPADAQSADFFCGSDVILENALKDPEFRHKFEEQESLMYDHFKKGSTRPEVASQVVTLPIVFHIIHDNGPENITDAEISTALNRLNESFSNMAYYDQGSGFNTMIQFCLARRTPLNLATSGITRNVSPLTVVNMNTQDVALKNLNRWTPQDFINVWLVRAICSSQSCSVAGYAYLPGAHGTSVDGIVLESNWLLSPSNVGVLTHELGHYLGLFHTFEGGCTNNDCLADGDRVCDTPPDQSTQWVPCHTLINSCTTDTQSGFSSDQPDMITNYMDYTDFDCFHDFTEGQALRMLWVIENTRKSLLESKACQDPCPNPVGAFFSGPNTGLAGETLNFTNGSSNAVSYEWSVDGVPFSTDVQASYTFPQVGQYKVTLKAIPADTLLCQSVIAEKTVSISCPVMADFSVSDLYPATGTTVTIINNSQGASNYNWFVNGLSQGNSLNSYTPLAPGLYILRLEAGNGFCSELHYEYLSVQNETVDTTCARFWVKSIGDATETDFAGNILAARDGRLYLTGSRRDSSLIIKMTPDGDVLWQISCKLSNYYGEIISQIIEDSDGNIVGCGVAYNSQNDLFIGFTFKLDPITRQLIWVYNNPPTPQSYYFAIVEKSPGGNYIAFNSWHKSPSPGSFDDLNWLEIDRNTGQFTANKFAYSLGTSESAQEAQIHNGSVYTVGRYTYGASLDGFRGAMSRFDLSGNLQWSQMQLFNQNVSARNYATDFVINGVQIATLIYGDFSGTNLYTNEFVITSAIAETGAVVFTSKYTLPSNLVINPRSIVKEGDSYIVFCFSATPEKNAYLIKTDFNGNVIWAWKYNNFNGVRSEKCITVVNGALYMIGTTNFDISVMKIDPATGLAGGNCPLPEALVVHHTPMENVSQAVTLTKYNSPATQVVRNTQTRTMTLPVITNCAQICGNEICGNGLDDDGDNLFDCLDPDCDCEACDGQQARFWYFGDKAGLDFSTEPPTVINNGQTYSNETTAVVSDPLGNLLFYSDGIRVFNRNHQQMPDGFGLNGHPSSSQMLILPQPGKPWRFYLFTPSTLDAIDASSAVKYTVVDMSLEGGLGNVLVAEKNIPLVPVDLYTEKLTATRHCNGRDWWVVVKERNNNKYRVYLLDENGLGAPVISLAGTVSSNNFNSVGCLKFNPEGNLLVNPLFHDSGIDLLHFDKSTGIISNAITITHPAIFGAYGTEFSENGKYLYVSSLRPPSNINQFDISQYNAGQILSSRVTIATYPSEYRFGQLQRAPNNKIYVTNSGPLLFTSELGIINQPNLPGLSCDYQNTAFSIAPGRTNLGLPSFPQQFFPRALDPVISGPDTICFLHDSILYNLNLDVCSLDSVVWRVNNGGILSIISPTSVNAIFSQPGDYQITALVFSPCIIASDTFYVQVDGNGNLVPDLGPDITLCENSIQVLSPGVGFARYRWNDGSSEPTLTTLFPGTYWVDVWDSCNQLKSDTIQISTFPIPPLDLGGDTSACAPVTYTLPAGFVSWNWQPNVGLSCPDCTPVIVSPTGTATYHVTALTADGCISVASLALSVSDLRDTVEVAYCPGDVLNLGTITIAPYSDTSFILNIPGNGQCDTIRLYRLVKSPNPGLIQTLYFCPGTSIVIDGIEYTEPGTVQGVIAAAEGCDTLVTYVLNFAPQPSITKNIAFCPGESVLIDGVLYNQPGIVPGILQATQGCDTLATYVLSFAPQPTTTRVVRFCQGESVVIDGISYSQPGTVSGVLPASVGCDTLVTYTLQFAVTGQSSTMTMQCPLDVVVETSTGNTSELVNYSLPTASTDCICPGVNIALQQGLPSGSFFPPGETVVCYEANDSCGSVVSCCFKVRVVEQAVCDVKNISCIKYELLGISQNASQQKTYYIRVTNQCAQQLIYFSAQLPTGMNATSPANFSNFTAPSGRVYTVRAPNASPFHSVRFQSQLDGISGGQSDIFHYTLPQQADVDYIHVLVRLKDQIYYEAHLNTFNCVVENVPAQPTGQQRTNKLDMLLYPNPTGGELYLSGLHLPVGNAQIRILDARGREVFLLQNVASESPVILSLPANLPSGLFVLDVCFEDGSNWQGRFVKE